MYHLYLLETIGWDFNFFCFDTTVRHKKPFLNFIHLWCFMLELFFVLVVIQILTINYVI